MLSEIYEKFLLRVAIFRSGATGGITGPSPQMTACAPKRKLCSPKRGLCPEEINRLWATGVQTEV